MKILFTLLLLLSPFLSAKDSLVFAIMPVDQTQQTKLVELLPDENKELLTLAAEFGISRIHRKCDSPKYYFGAELDMGSAHELEIRIAIESLSELPKPIYIAIMGKDASPQEESTKAKKLLPSDQLGEVELELKTRVPNQRRPAKSKTRVSGKDILERHIGDKPLISEITDYIKLCTKRDFKSNSQLPDENALIEVNFRNKNGRIEFSFTEKEVEDIPSFISSLLPNHQYALEQKAFE